MAELIRSRDWEETPLGPIAGWSSDLRAAVKICLASRHPIVLYWGNDFVLLYNDAWRPIVGNKHPYALGRSAREIWAEIWDVFGTMLEGVLATGVATWSEDQLLELNRYGFTEECYFSYSLSPVHNDGGKVEGIFTAVSETTPRVLGERRLKTLQRLGQQIGESKTIPQAFGGAVETLRANAYDLPFALFYQLENEGQSVRLVGTTGIDAGSAGAPITTTVEANPWPLAEVLRTSGSCRSAELPARMGGFPGGPWPEATHTAFVLPLARAGHEQPFGFLVAGVSPRRIIDDAYTGFLDLVASNIASALDSANAYDEARERAEQLAALDRAKTSFFSNVSHEFRTPLTLMLGPTEEALASGQPLAGEELRAVHRNELRLLKLVNTLLDFSRLQEGRAHASFEPTNLTELTSGLASTFRSAIERVGLSFHVDCPPLEGPFYVDRSMWEKVVFNLLSNALKFTLEGEIEVALVPTQDGASLQVRDTGSGIPPQELPRIFERFHRIEGQKGRTHEGSGIGLALVAEIVKMHGGTLSVDSTVGVGSTFSVHVKRGSAHLDRERIGPGRGLTPPTLRAEAYIAEAVQGSSDGHTLPSHDVTVDLPGVTNDPTAGARILLADDNADMRDYVGRLLAQRWQVETVADGEAALAAARLRRPDLILSDVMMPVLDGFGLIKALRADDGLRSIPVVLLSARAGEESRVAGLESGADDYLVKPFSARELFARVTTSLQLANLRAATLRASETQWKIVESLFRSAPTPIALLRGEKLVFEFLNQSTAEIWRRPADALMGKPLLDALPELRGQGFDQLLLGVMRSGEPFVANEMPVPMRRGDRDETHILNFVYAPVRNEDGMIDRVSIFAFDVTTIVEARKSVEAAMRFSDQFVGILGHDLRNPLSSIAMGTALLKKKLAGMPEARTVERISSSAGRMSRMVSQLLDLTRGRLGGGIPIVCQRTNFSDVVTLAVDELRTAYPERHFATDILPNVTGQMDGDRLAQVVSNLAGNAVQHGDTSKPVEIRLTERAQVASLQVRNYGTPIPAALLPLIFEPFRRGPKESHARLSSGLGLGLYISQQIILAHGGKISVDSNDEATTFAVELPLLASPEAKSEVSDEMHPRSSDIPNSGE